MGIGLLCFISYSAMACLQAPQGGMLHGGNNSIHLQWEVEMPDQQLRLGSLVQVGHRSSDTQSVFKVIFGANRP